MRIIAAAGLASAVVLVGLLHAPVLPVAIGALATCAWLWRSSPSRRAR
jgi:hypothetical protein